MDDGAFDIGEAEVAAGVTVGEFFVVEAERVEDGRLQVVDMDRLFDRLEPEVVGGAANAVRILLQIFAHQGAVACLHKVFIGCHGIGKPLFLHH